MDTCMQALLQYPSCLQWSEGFKSPATKKKYTILLNKFCQFHQTTPDALLEKTPEQLKSMAINYVIHLKKVAKPVVGKARKGEISVNSVSQYLVGVRHFLDFHEKEVSWKKIDNFYPEQVVNDLVPYTLEQIKALLAMASLRDRCMIYLFVSSGIRAGAIHSLYWRNLQKLDNGLAFLIVYEKSKEDRYRTLVTPECLQELEKYKAWRLSMGEKVGPDSPLLRDQFAPLSKLTSRPKSLKYSAVNAAMRRLLSKAAFPFDNIQPDHGFRKYFSTTCRNNKVDKEFKRLLLGQSSELEDIYDFNESEESKQEFINEYVKAVDALTINEENRLKKQVQELTVKADRIAEIESRLANLGV